MTDVLAQSRTIRFDQDEKSHLWDCCGCACCVAQHVPATTNAIVVTVRIKFEEIPLHYCEQISNLWSNRLV
jgi:hypothetical protein